MYAFTRKLGTAIIAATLTATAGFGIAAGVIIDRHLPSGHSSAGLKTAGYNDGWTDGQADLADMLGHRMPSASEERELITAQHDSGTSCHLEWDGKKANQYEAICAPSAAQAACAKAAQADEATCLKLYARPAASRVNSDGSTISDPAGPSLVAECTSQYKGVELHFCLTQPAE